MNWLRKRIFQQFFQLKIVYFSNHLLGAINPGREFWLVKSGTVPSPRRRVMTRWFPPDLISSIASACVSPSIFKNKHQAKNEAFTCGGLVDFLDDISHPQFARFRSWPV